ncbi:aminopeptidase [Acholeplasma equirhinis]|uniref:aminopeptidase n=1 Tax=Acholeplasma equirhinis TaxID=555393 RepID=UPI00197B0041|nr:aminopeptidase [Acholeplasma equirhinis]MBN3490807.1 aminopeptidase [Acholeplasma equirhinis]
MPNQLLLEKYARLAVKTGVNVQPGQIVVLRTTTEAVELSRAVAKEAYKAGAKRVYFIWTDEKVSRYGYDYAKTEDLAEFPEWNVAQYKYFVEQGACFISIVSPVPHALAGVDSSKMQTVVSTMTKAIQFFREHTMGNKTQWTIVAASNKAWAKELFPDLDEAVAEEKLWDAIFKATRVNHETDPVEVWKEHNANLARQNKILNDANFKSLHFTNSLGTDLVVELIQDHVWAGGAEHAGNGALFNPNIPTEESFTMPYKFGTQGKVVATKPLAYQGKIIKDFWLEFKDGRVVDFDAKYEKEALQSILDFDYNARSIGEIALIGHDSPISNMNILFLNTLYDENASCHMALGRAYPMNIKNGNDTPIAELEKKGYNNSLVHVDFMFGSADMQIVGKKQDGTEVIVFKNGNFAI